MAKNIHAAVQCSEDLGGQPPSFQTGVGAFQTDVGSFQTSVAVSVPDLQCDTDRAKQPKERPNKQETPPGTSAAGNEALPTDTPRETIVLTGRSGQKIEAEGLLSVLQPGGVFRMGVENRDDYFHSCSHCTPRKPSHKKNKYRLTDSTEEPGIRHLDVISAGLAEDWFCVGRHLGLTEATLQQIRMDYKAEGQHEVNYRVLARWKQMFSPVTVAMLAKALVEVGRGDLADELRKG